MSPSRTRRPVHRHRSRREVVTAVGGALAVVVLDTCSMIWLLRPGPPGVEGTGGLASRQPRAAWLVALTLAAARRVRAGGRSGEPAPVARQADHRASRSGAA